MEDASSLLLHVVSRERRRFSPNYYAREERGNGGGKKRRLFPPRALLRLHVVYYEEGRRNSLPAVDDPPLRNNDALPPLYTRVSIHEFILATFEGVATRGFLARWYFLVEMELGFDSFGFECLEKFDITRVLRRSRCI